MQAHAGLLLAELLHLPRQHFLLGGVQVVVPVLLRAIPFAEIQFQFVAEAVFLDIVVSINVEPIIILVGTHIGAESGIDVEVSLHIKVELAIRLDDLLAEGEISYREMSCRGDLPAAQMVQQFAPLFLCRCKG